MCTGKVTETYLFNNEISNLIVKFINNKRNINIYLNSEVDFLKMFTYKMCMINCVQLGSFEDIITKSGYLLFANVSYCLHTIKLN